MTLRKQECVHREQKNLDDSLKCSFQSLFSMEQFILLLIGDTKTKYAHILRQLEFPVERHMANIIFLKYYLHGFGTTEMMQP